MPKTLTFSSIDENILEFDGFCKDLPELTTNLFGKKVVTNQQLTILLQFIIEDLKKTSDESSPTFFRTLSVEKLKKAIFECYHYQYDYKKIFPTSKNEKILLVILNKLEHHLSAHNLLLKAASLNWAVSTITKAWDHSTKKRVFTILPQTDVNYISSFLNNLAKHEESVIFIRGFDGNLYNNVGKSHQCHISSFLNRNNILPQTVEDVENLIEYRDNNINILTAKNPNEEAKLISLFIREQLANGQKKIVVQTKSIDLAQKIESFLKLWDIDVDNLLSNSYRNNQELMLFLLIANYLNSTKNDYLFLLDILKSKYSKFYDKEELKDWELNYLRQHLYRENISDYFQELNQCQQEKFNSLLEFERNLKSAREEIKNEQNNLYKYFQIHVGVFNALRQNFDSSTLGQILPSIEKDLKHFKQEYFLNFNTYIAIIEEIISANMRTTNTMPNCSVQILQTFENRNMQYEVLVFAGLNEGIFPDTNLDHGYFHPYTRTANKLKSFDVEIGFMEYDFFNSLFNKNVVLSYSESLNGKTTKCRWLEKMLLTKEAKEQSDLFSRKYRTLLQQLQHEDKAVDRISGCVNMDVSSRPNKISVSGVEKLMSNPYVYYAKYIAKLNPLEDIGRSAGKKEFGIMLHQVLSQVCCERYDSLEGYTNEFTSLFYKCIKEYHVPFIISKLWYVRLKNIIKNMYQCRSSGAEIFSEIPGGIALDIANRSIYVHCISDKIEITKNGAKILDYKTGYVPSANEVNQGIYPQLAIEKFILLHGGFKDIQYSKIDAGVFYVDISGKSITNISISIAIDIEKTTAGLKKLLEDFLCNKTEFFVMNNAKTNKKNKEYMHLIRYVSG
ncbi:PD-(D/E)XK nuclease family protein [Candidatus Bandiella euplotis]|uniref:PD-(D/E)XK nuclease family protein n=1 Tax=Candidatus Bandiella euplotis TaxID=1664265 RepID=UPI002B261ADC|nr:PD-(D/E)XK nuclease family protein [Candidatus Bandiella woodruffii]